jgi:hypothetical protein
MKKKKNVKEKIKYTRITRIIIITIKLRHFQIIKNLKN